MDPYHCTLQGPFESQVLFRHGCRLSDPHSVANPKSQPEKFKNTSLGLRKQILMALLWKPLPEEGHFIHITCTLHSPSVPLWRKLGSHLHLVKDNRGFDISQLWNTANNGTETQLVSRCWTSGKGNSCDFCQRRFLDLIREHCNPFEGKKISAFNWSFPRDKDYG